MNRMECEKCGNKTYLPLELMGNLELREKLKAVEAENALLKSCVEFYGEYSWKCSTPPFYDLGNFMDEPNDYEKQGHLQVFGKKARETLEAIRGES